MSSRKVFPGDTQWAIAGQFAAPVLVKLGRRLPRWLHGDGHRVVTGKDGFAALLVFGGPTDDGDPIVAELVKTGPVYLLDFDDELDFEEDAYAIQEFTSAGMEYVPGYPNEFLEARGIIAPGWEPARPSPVVTAGVVEGITAEEAQRAYPDVVARFAAHPRGVLVTGGAASGIAIDLSMRRKLRAYAVYFNREDGDFSCVVSEPDGSDACFALDHPSPNYPPLDSVLGETTLDGILRVLEIPRECLPGLPPPRTPA
jgi:hypothetical protein